VPWFVVLVNGQPDHRIIDSAKLPVAHQEHRCWICGDPRGRYLTFLLGPMCTITRTVSEPPSHLDCATYAVQACPFMTRPHMVRREAGLPDDWRDAPGLPLHRNPGVVCLWTTRTYQPFGDGKGGVLFRVGDPTSTAWYCEGRPATLGEVEASLTTGLPALQEVADREGREARVALQLMTTQARRYLPRQEVVHEHA